MISNVRSIEARKAAERALIELGMDVLDHLPGPDDRVSAPGAPVLTSRRDRSDTLRGSLQADYAPGDSKPN